MSVPDSSQFGPIFMSTEFDGMVEGFLQKWLDTYLSEVELRNGLDRRTVDRPKSYNATVSVEHWPEDRMPGILVVSAGFPDELQSLGDGLRGGWWHWVVVALLTGRDYDSTRKKVGIYQAALRTLLEKNGGMDGAVSETIITSEPMDYAPFEGRDRTRGVAAFECQSFITAVVDSTPGPVDPDPPAPPDDPSEPHPDWPIVQTVDVQVDRQQLDD